MKPIGEMGQEELAAFVQTHLRDERLEVILSGGAAVSIYSNNKFISRVLDLISKVFSKRDWIREAMEEIGFREAGRHFDHPDTEFLIEFPPGPLSVGGEPVAQIEELEYETGTLRVISPTDCVKDRLAAYYHWNDQQCLVQATLVAEECVIDIEEVRRWSAAEGKLEAFEEISDRLRGEGGS